MTPALATGGLHLKNREIIRQVCGDMILEYLGSLLNKPTGVSR